MTFDPGIPVKTQSPGAFPDQMHANLNRLKALIEAEHVFNNTYEVNDGIHKQVSLINRDLPTTLAHGESGILSSRSNALGQSFPWWYNGIGYYPQSTTKAFVNFNGVTLAITDGSYNVATVTRYGGPGRYRIQYIVPFVSLANAGKYTVQVTCMCQGETVIGTIRNTPIPSAVMTNVEVYIETVKTSGSHIDCEYVGVTINSYI